MSHSAVETEVLINISHDAENALLELHVFMGASRYVHHLSLAQARALSLAIIKQVYLAELKRRAGDAVTNSQARRSGASQPAGLDSTYPSQISHTNIPAFANH